MNTDIPQTTWPQINWRAWGRDAFIEAQKADKPILLSLTSSWCHWCREMETSTYLAPEIVERIARDYVAIKVDGDRRPDVNSRYNMGGLPSTVFLTPTGDTLTGATFIAAPEMRNVLQQISSVYKTQHAAIYQRIHATQANALTQENEPSFGREADRSVMEWVTRQVTGMFDKQNGGFGTMPKFPAPEVLEYLLFLYGESRDASYADMVRKTLDGMARGEIWDSAGGGFFRSANGIDWTQPHYEKVLEVNAAMAAVYARAWRVAGGETYRSVAEATLGYILGTLRDAETGAFLGSQAAHEDYYRTAPSARAGMPAPAVDRTVYMDGASRAVSAFLHAAAALGGADHRDAAVRCLEFLRTRMAAPDGRLSHYYDLVEGAQGGPGLFRDYVYFMQALADAHQATGEGVYLSQARAMAETVQKSFGDTTAPGYFDLPAGHEQLGYLRYRRKLLPENAVYAGVLLTLYYLTEKPVYLEWTRTTLEGFVPLYGDLGHFAAGYAQAVVRLLGETVEFHIVGPQNAKETVALAAACLRQTYPNVVVRVLDPQRDAEVIEDRAYDVFDAPTVYACVGTACAPPLRTPSDLEDTVETLINAARLLGEDMTPRPR